MAIDAKPTLLVSAMCVDEISTKTGLFNWTLQYRGHFNNFFHSVNFNLHG